MPLGILQLIYAVCAGLGVFFGTVAVAFIRAIYAAYIANRFLNTTVTLYDKQCAQQIRLIQIDSSSRVKKPLSAPRVELTTADLERLVKLAPAPNATIKLEKPSLVEKA